MKLINTISIITSKVCIYIAILCSILGLWRFSISGDVERDYSSFSNRYKFDFNKLLLGLEHFDGYALMSLAILILMLVPLIRVLCLLIEYILLKNKLYTVISLLILMIVFISFLMGVKE